MPRAALGLYVAALLVVGQLTALFHFALVQHDVCSDHGELMHAGDAPAAAAAAIAREPLAVPGDADHGLAHEHCNSLARPSESAAVADAAAGFAIVAPPEGRQAVNSYAARARSRLTALVVAPKQSPPLA
jgi:hypothetical protein